MKCIALPEAPAVARQVTATEQVRVEAGTFLSDRAGSPAVYTYREHIAQGCPQVFNAETTSGARNHAIHMRRRGGVDQESTLVSTPKATTGIVGFGDVTGGGLPRGWDLALSSGDITDELGC